MLSYSIVVTNGGPGDVMTRGCRMHCRRHWPDSAWTCTATARALVRHGDGVGDIDALVTLPVGTSATFTVSGTPPAGMSGALTNTATVTPPFAATDPVPGNNEGDRQQSRRAASRPDRDQGEQPQSVCAGAALTYTVVVANTGPSNVTNARVQDVLPPPLAGFGWTCSASRVGASCATPAGSGTSMRW